MAEPFSPELRGLLAASNLGLSSAHPLAGWVVLTILYQEGSSSSETMTLDYLLRRYNNGYLELDETPLTGGVLHRVLDVLSGSANLIESSPRKIRVHMRNGTTHIQQSWAYRITSGGIEYWTAMQKVLDAESTVAVNITRIDEYCQLVQKLVKGPNLTTTTQLYNDFRQLLTAYEDVMKGMHKLDEDLSELANDLSFNHGSEAAEFLQTMLSNKAVPAFDKLLAQGPGIQFLAYSASFSDQVAHSQQGDDDLDATHAVNNQAEMLLRFERTKQYVKRQLNRLSASFDSSASAIDSSADTVYLLFQTILDAIKLLSQEYDHIQSQSVDVKALTTQIDKLLVNYRSVHISQAIPKHLGQDRELEDTHDLLEATTLGAVTYTASVIPRVVATEQDNPIVVKSADLTSKLEDGLAEFRQLVMKSDVHGVVDSNLEFKTGVARDEVVRLASAIGYTHYESFAPFGGEIKDVKKLGEQLLAMHVTGEKYQAYLPSGFQFWFTK